MALTIRKKQSAPGLYHGGPGSRTRVSVANLIATASLDGTSVTLTWDAPSVSYVPASSLHQIYKAGSFINTVPGTQQYYVDNAVSPGVTYIYQVFLIYNPS